MNSNEEKQNFRLKLLKILFQVNHDVGHFLSPLMKIFAPTSSISHLFLEYQIRISRQTFFVFLLSYVNQMMLINEEVKFTNAYIMVFSETILYHAIQSTSNTFSLSLSSLEAHAQ